MMIYTSKGTKEEMLIRNYEVQDEKEVIGLWQRCGLVVPWNDPAEDIRRKIRVDADLFLVGVREGRIIATVMAGYEGHRGWLNYLAVLPQYQGHGLGRAMVEEAERRIRTRGCPKINLQVRTDNAGVIAFYEALGYVMDDVVSLGKRLVDDTRPEQGRAVGPVEREQ